MKLRTRTIHFVGDNTAQATQKQKYPGQTKKNPYHTARFPWIPELTRIHDLVTAQERITQQIMRKNLVFFWRPWAPLTRRNAYVRCCRPEGEALRMFPARSRPPGHDRGMGGSNSEPFRRVSFLNPGLDFPKSRTGSSVESAHTE